jgi:hypothetical protein
MSSQDAMLFLSKGVPNKEPETLNWAESPTMGKTRSADEKAAILRNRIRHNQADKPAQEATSL